jgi:hypothetical protein
MRPCSQILILRRQVSSALSFWQNVRTVECRLHEVFVWSVVKRPPEAPNPNVLMPFYLLWIFCPRASYYYPHSLADFQSRAPSWYNNR